MEDHRATIDSTNTEGSLYIKVLWVVSVGTVARVMISFAEIEGIKMNSNLVGFPVAILMFLMIASLTLALFKHKSLLFIHKSLNRADEQ